jgi:hypothetical protein
MHEGLEHYHEKGFAIIRANSIDSFDGQVLIDAVESLERDGVIQAGGESMQNLNDAVYLNEEIMKFATHPSIVALVEAVIGRKVELQHSKMINKYATQGVASKVKWHQDYPFFPHTNYDICALGFHFDDEFEGAGAIDFLEGSHKGGLIPHCDAQTGEFKYEIVDPSFDPSNYVRTAAVCSAGDITIHHGNTIHASSPISNHKRRVLYIQYRAIDAIQIAGALWRCTGLSPYPEPIERRSVRFMGGEVLEIRTGARLFDQFGLLAPDKDHAGSITGD